jgi:mannose-6-phosphate isomerase-like protein (cupin superfamily)
VGKSETSRTGRNPEPTGSWGTDGFFFTEAARGGPTIWRQGAEKLEGDGLGPVRHAHDDAGEYYFMFRGSAHVETGGEEFILEEGQLGYIPPNAPHNFLGPAGDADACLFCLVAPNLADNKWRVRDFLPGSEDLRMSVATPFADAELPGDDRLTARSLSLRSSDGALEVTPEHCELVYLVVSGVAELSLANGLRGSIQAGTYVHLREGMNHRIQGHEDGCRVLRMDARFDAWAGVPGAADAG